MTELSTQTLAKPQIGIGVKDGIAAKILARLQEIGKSKKVFEKDESVVGIFKAFGLSGSHLVLTNYRICGVVFVRPRGTVVFNNERTEKDMESVTVRAKKGLFNQKLYYDIEIEKGGKSSKYATVQTADADSITKLVEGIQTKDLQGSLIEAQQLVALEEDAERQADHVKKVAERQAQQDELKKTRAEQVLATKQAKAIAEQAQKAAGVARAQSRGRKLGSVHLKYIGGYSPELAATVFESSLDCYENEVWYKGRNISVSADQITSFEITGEERTTSRLSVTRIVALGVFSLAAPKRSTKKEASIYIGLRDGRQVLFRSDRLSESDVHRKLANAISHYSALRASSLHGSSPATTELDQLDVLEKYAALHKQGILTDEEFQAKKQQLLGL